MFFENEIILFEVVAREIKGSSLPNTSLSSKELQTELEGPHKPTL